MTISPTLGISNQYDARPVMEYASIASQSLQQLGAQLQNDITTIQTNQQLRSFQQDLQGINPLDTKSPQFAVQMTQAITNNPLAAHSPVGIQAINQLGAAHQAAIQGGFLGQRLQTQEDVAGIRAGATTGAAGIRADASKYGADARLQGTEEGIDAKNAALDVTEAGKNARQASRIKSAQDLANSKIQIKDGKVWDAQGNVISDYGDTNAPVGVMSDHQKAATQLSNAQQKNILAESAFKQNPNDPSVAATYRATQQGVNDAATEFQVQDQKLKSYGPKKSGGATPSQDGSTPLSKAVPRAAAAPSTASQSSGSDKFYKYAIAHPEDPRSAAILKKLSEQGYNAGGQ